MAESHDASRRPNRRRQYFLDDASQSSVVGHVLGLIAATGLVTALTLFGLSRPGVLGSQSVAAALPVLLAALVACFVFAGLVAIPVVLRLTHRYVGPALVMRRALRGMRHGDYGCRLRLRRRDYLQALAEEIDAHRSEIARRDVSQARLVQSIRNCLEEGDLEAARACLRVHGRRIQPERTDSLPEESFAA